MGAFADSFKRFGVNAPLALRDVVSAATADMVNEMQTTKFKGGRLGIDTGNLRSSIIAALNSEPSGESGMKQGTGDQETGAVVALLIKAKPGDTIKIRWIAEYAIYHNNRTGFISIPAARWPQFISKSARAFESRV